METQVLRVKPRKPFKNNFPEITGRREQLPYYIDFNFPASTRRRLRPLIYRLRPEGSCHSLVFPFQQEGGYDLLSLPCLATLIRRRLSNLWTCHIPNPALSAADNLCTLITAKSSLYSSYHCNTADVHPCTPRHTQSLDI